MAHGGESTTTPLLSKGKDGAGYGAWSRARPNRMGPLAAAPVPQSLTRHPGGGCAHGARSGDVCLPCGRVWRVCGAAAGQRLVLECCPCGDVGL